jgi:hypothetical protein
LNQKNPVVLQLKKNKKTKEEKMKNKEVRIEKEALTKSDEEY